MTRPLFTIIIPTYGRPRFLAEAIDSVLRQTRGDFECIVVDDASPTPVEVPADPRIRLIRRAQNGGEPAARNTGLQHALGEYVGFLDDDDLFTPDRLELGIEGLARAPVSICWRQDLDGVIGGRRMLEGDIGDIVLDEMTPQIGQVVIERSSCPEFSEEFTALTDVDWWFRATRTLPVATVPRPGLVYRLHSGPRNRNGQEARVQCSLMLMAKYSDYFKARPSAAAFRWKRIGLMAQRLGDHELARHAFVCSLRLRPQIKTLWHVSRSFRRSRIRLRDGSGLALAEGI